MKHIIENYIYIPILLNKEINLAEIISEVEKRERKK